MSYVMMETWMMEMVVIVPVNQKILSMGSVEQELMVKYTMEQALQIKRYFVILALEAISCLLQDRTEQQEHGIGNVMEQVQEQPTTVVKQIG
jgi:hypothetical protein